MPSLTVHMYMETLLTCLHGDCTRTPIHQRSSCCSTWQGLCCIRSSIDTILKYWIQYSELWWRSFKIKLLPVYIYICVCVLLYMYTTLCRCICICICMCHVHVYERTRACVWAYECQYVRVSCVSSLYIYIYIYIYMLFFIYYACAKCI